MEVNNNNPMQKLYEIASKQLQENGEITTPYVEIDTQSKEKEVTIENADEEVSVDFEDSAQNTDATEKETDTESNDPALQMLKSISELPNEDILQIWKNQAYIQRLQSGIGYEFSDIINQYQIQGGSQKLSFEDLVKIGEYYSGKANKVDERAAAEQFLAQSAQSAQAQQLSQIQQTQQASQPQTVSVQPVQQTEESTDAITTESTTDIITGNEVGSIDYVTSAMQMAMPDSDFQNKLVNYTLIYDSQGRISELKNNGKFDTTLPDIKIQYAGKDELAEEMKSATIIQWKNSDDKTEFLYIADFAENGKTISMGKEDGDITTKSYDSNNILQFITTKNESTAYDKDGNVTAVSTVIKAGESYTYKGIKITNTTNKEITAAFAITEDGGIRVSTMDENNNINVGTISYEGGKDAVSSDKVSVITEKDGGTKPLNDTQKTENSSDKATSEELTSFLKKLKELLNNLNL